MFAPLHFKKISVIFQCIDCIFLLVMFKLLSLYFINFYQSEERRDHAQISFEVSPKFILNQLIT